jgi:hypothetical protein
VTAPVDTLRYGNFYLRLLVQLTSDADAELQEHDVLLKVDCSKCGADTSDCASGRIAVPWEEAAASSSILMLTSQVLPFSWVIFVERTE